MKPFTHKKCLGVRGVKFFKCERCECDTNNYMNGINLCIKCCKETNTCQICGEGLKMMDRIDYQDTISNLFDKALNNLDAKDFDILIQRIKETIEDYN